ncbi:MORN repeat protein [Chitinophaga sp. S165]|nr:MORN repeat protein [Chitinophaga sp. S165]
MSRERFSISINSSLLCHFFLLLFVTGGSACTGQDEHNNELLRQVMREENGHIRWKVYGFRDDPYKEKVEIYYGNGKLKEVYFRKAGRMEGIRTVFFDNGNLSESGNWHEDNRVGEFRYYQQNGHLECVQHFGLIGESVE